MGGDDHIVLIGCGKMGRAMLQGWLKSSPQNQYTVIDPGLENPPHDDVALFPSLPDAAEHINAANIFILAVKPQMMMGVCNNLAKTLPASALILSIAAGCKIESFENYFGPEQPIIRAMPNTPAAIGKGITVAVANANVSLENSNKAKELLKATGKFEWIDEEEMMDTVTAMSGSGPAYVFHLIEMLAKAGVENGLPENLSMTLARQTVIGSGALADSEPQTSAETLRENVTSPNGTTAAALRILMDGRAQNLLNDTVAAATHRSEELRE